MVTKDKIELSASLQRRLAREWQMLTNEKNYLIPETPEDFRKFGPFPFFEIGSVMVFAKDNVETAILKIAESVREEVGVDRFSLQTVYQALREEIKSHFSEKKGKSFANLESILNSIQSKESEREHSRIVCGLVLKDFNHLSVGGWSIQRLDEASIKVLADRVKENERHREQILKFLNNRLKNKTVITVRCQGDEEQSRMRAEHISRYVLNVFRLFIVVHMKSKNAQHFIDIQLDSMNNDSVPSFSFDTASRSYTMRIGVDILQYRQDYKLTSRNLTILRESWNADYLWSLVERLTRNDIQDSLVTAVTWFGDAQQERDPHVAYVKYWTALEALITGHEEGRQDARLKIVIPILIRQHSKNVPTKTQVSNAYDLRSKVIHRGSLAQVRRADVDTLCRWTAECITSVVTLSLRGYQTRSDLEKHSYIIDKSGKSDA